MPLAAHGPKGQIFFARIIEAFGGNAFAGKISDYEEEKTTVPGHPFPGWRVSFKFRSSVPLRFALTASKSLRSNDITFKDGNSEIALDKIRTSYRDSGKPWDAPVVESDDGTGTLEITIHNARRL